ncbi:MAG: efflux RND transporter periplasmic adaptor subunit [Clostridium butyricum]|nr:efflux RND transporter periplasmic adaptor subunit [Clostridium butyricum]
MKKFLIIALTFISILLVGCGEKPVEEEKSIAVTVQAAKNQGIQNTNVFSGITKVKDDISLTTEIGGIVEEMYVNLGDEVKAGQQLLKLKGTDTENSIKTAEAALNSAKAAYKDSDITIANSQNQLESSLNNAKIALDKAQASYNETQRQFNNQEQLYQAGAISEDAYKQSKAGLDQSKKGVEQAQVALDTAQKSYDIGVSNREQAKAAIDQSKVAYDNAVSVRNKLTLVSPVDGVITSKNYDVNEMAVQSQPAFVISSLNTLEVDISVTQADINKFSANQTVNVTIDGQKVEGTVRYVPTVTDSKSSLYVVEVLIDNSNGDFNAGMAAEVEVSTEKQDDTITVPKKAIFEEDGQSYVYIVGEDSRAVKTEITKGIETDSQVEITSGVHTDDTIVIGGLSLIGDNTKLFPVEKKED